MCVCVLFEEGCIKQARDAAAQTQAVLTSPPASTDEGPEAAAPQEQEDDEEEEHEGAGGKEAPVLDSLTLAELGASALMRGVRPPPAWLQALEGASAAVFRATLAAADPDSGFSGMVAGAVHPAAVVNMLTVLRESGHEVPREWVELAMLAVAATDPRGGGGEEAAGKVARERGDDLASLLFEVARQPELLLALAKQAQRGATAQEEGEGGDRGEGEGGDWQAVLRAVAAIAGRAAALWEAQAEADQQVSRHKP